MKKLLNILLIVMSLGCTNSKWNRKLYDKDFPNKELENDTVLLELEYYGWGCPCPQWITKENMVIFESKVNESEEMNLSLFWNIKPANDSLPYPFELTDDLESLTFEFKGRFFVEPQFLGDEGEQGPAKTLLYYSVRHIK